MWRRRDQRKVNDALLGTDCGVDEIGQTDQGRYERKGGAIGRIVVMRMGGVNVQRVI